MHSIAFDRQQQVPLESSQNGVDEPVTAARRKTAVRQSGSNSLQLQTLECEMHGIVY